MIKYGFIIAACGLCIACGEPANKGAATLQKDKAVNTPVVHPVSSDSLINPGKGIGIIRLGEDASEVTNRLGKPDSSDAAMGASLMTWYAGHDTTGHLISIYAHRNMGAADENINHIKQIRITSPSFKTAQQIHTGSLLDSIRKYYTLSAPKQNLIYDAVKAGITFEISAGKCTAIVVHAAGDSSATYIDIRPHPALSKGEGF